MTDKNIVAFLKAQEKATREEEVITGYHKLIPGDWLRPFGSDGLNHETLYEFKYDLKLDKGAGFTAIAQGCYYLRRIWTSGVHKGLRYTLPTRLVVGDTNEAIVLPVEELKPLFTNDKFDWTRAPSSPDPALVHATRDLVKKPVVFKMDKEEQIKTFLDVLKTAGTVVRCEITHHNFVSLFLTWCKLFPPDQCTAQELAFAYLTDLTGHGIAINAEDGVVVFKKSGTVVELRCSVEQYQRFWMSYRRPPTNDEMKAITERKDQLVAIQQRRMTGEFFTPLDICELAHQYLYTADDKIYERPWWDMCAGTGNLVFHVPAHTPLFISTLNKEDLEVLKDSGQNPGAEIFQFDFLNDPWEKLPKKLVKALEHGKVTVLINPPFAAGTDLQSKKDAEKVKTGVSNTETAKAMDGLSHAVQNTYTQFMFRLLDLASTYKVEITLGLFSKAIFASGPGYEAFRKLWSARCEPLGGFTFHAEEFEGTKGKWPVSYSMFRIKS